MSTPEAEAAQPTTEQREFQADEKAIARALSTTPRPPRASVRTSTLAFGWRGMLKVKHVPEQLLDVTVTPVMFVLMFTYLFGGAIAGSTSAYRDFVIPGVLAMAVIFTTVYSGIAINTDLTKGVIDRFRSLPIWKPSPLVGALLGDCVRYLVAGTVIIVLGLILGFRPDNGVPGVLAALGLVILFSFSLSWVFTTLGLLMRSPNAVMNAGFMSLFPIVFLTNIYVDPATLPDGLREFVEANPVSHLVECTRGLMNGTLDATNLIVVLATAFALTAVFAPLTSRLYRRS